MVKLLSVGLQYYQYKKSAGLALQISSRRRTAALNGGFWGVNGEAKEHSSGMKAMFVKNEISG
jgi:hypothetical protein